jgi:hypothetical protein
MAIQTDITAKFENLGDRWPQSASGFHLSYLARREGTFFGAPSSNFGEAGSDTDETTELLRS